MEIIGGKYKIENIKLGSGTFSTVWLGANIVTDEPVAIKKIPLSHKQSLLDKVSIEIETMKQMNHPNIVKYYDVVKTESEWYIIMEHCDAGNFQDVIKFNEAQSKLKKISFVREANTFYYMNQLKEALSYLRQKGLIHRDIKPANVLLKRTLDMPVDYYHTGGLIVKLADFGLAKFHYDNEASMNNTICGSPLYMAPELLIDMKYGPKADLWSYGIILYEFLHGTNPSIASNIPQLRKNLITKEINFHLGRNFTPDCFDLLIQLLNKDQDKRIEWTKFFNHRWFVYWSSSTIEEKEAILLKNGIKSDMPPIKYQYSKSVPDIISFPKTPPNLKVCAPFKSVKLPYS